MPTLAASAAPEVPGESALVEGLAAARRQGGAGWHEIHFAGPAATPSALRAMASTFYLWAPRDRAATYALGAAATLTATGDERFAQLKSATTSLRLPPHARVYGGFAFAPGAAAGPAVDTRWQRFGDARFIVPRWTYDGAEKNWTLWVRDEELPSDANDPRTNRWQQEFRAIAMALAERISARPPLLAPGHATTPAEWTARIEQALAAIAAGRVEKVALARTATWSGIPEISAIIAALLANSEATRFAFAPEADTCFVGASPEWLIRRQGRSIETEALAGSQQRGSRPSMVTALLTDDKNRREHEVVAEVIRSALAPYAQLAPRQATTVQSLRHLHHLRESIVGELGADTHVLDLVTALHPTPAVGGWPKEKANALIAELEPTRGWYAGPVGWFNGAGDGEFAVAIRSALIEHNAATLWTGCGIVAGSRAPDEWAETAWKQRTMLDALGHEGA